MRFLLSVSGFSLRDMVKSSDIRKELRVEVVLLCIKKESTDQDSDQDSSWTPPCRGIPDISNWEVTHNTPEGLGYI